MKFGTGGFFFTKSCRPTASCLHGTLRQIAANISTNRLRTSPTTSATRGTGDRHVMSVTELPANRLTECQALLHSVKRKFCFFPPPPHPTLLVRFCLNSVQMFPNNAPSGHQSHGIRRTDRGVGGTGWVHEFLPAFSTFIVRFGYILVSASRT